MKIILNESLYKQLQEAFSTFHLRERITTRLNGLGLPKEEIRVIRRNLNNVFQTDFPEDQEFAIKIHDLYITDQNPNFFIDNHNGEDKEIFKSSDGSMGNELWVIVKGNKVVTLMLVKDYVIYNPQRFFKVANILDWT